MKKLLLIAGAGGVGYLLGARAGRPVYDRFVASVGRLTTRSGLDSAAGTVVSAGVDLRDAATARAADKVKDLSSAAAAQVADRVDAARAHVEPHTEPLVDTRVEPHVEPHVVQS